MTLVPLENVRKIFTNDYVYDTVSDVEQVYLNGNQFLKFTYLSRFTNLREVSCIASDTVKKIDYYSQIPELKTQAEVIMAYREGRLVGY